jgi:hypothetical protein
MNGFLFSASSQCSHEQTGNPAEVWLLLALPLQGDMVYCYHSKTGEGYAGCNYRDTDAR